MTVAHIAGVPLEEWFTPLAASGSTFVIALRAALWRARRQVGGNA
jgi:hypothetical protein